MTEKCSKPSCLAKPELELREKGKKVLLCPHHWELNVKGWLRER